MTEKPKTAFKQAKENWQAPTPKKYKRAQLMSIVTSAFSFVGLVTTNLISTGIDFPQWLDITLAITSAGGALSAFLTQFKK